jgi:rhodanese-related sulfurtransferase
MNKERHREFKDELFGQLARVTKALSSPRRLELVDLLAQRERSVEELAELAEMSVANTSQHLQELRAASLVKVRREGLRAHYSLANESVFRVWQAIRDLGQIQIAEIDRIVAAYATDRGKFEELGAEELMRRMADGDVVVLDVRPKAEFEAGHIRSARSVPVPELRRRIAEIPKGLEIVAYCRGPFCVYADEAAALLRRNGYRARRLKIGYPDWKYAGLPVAVGKEKRTHCVVGSTASSSGR